MSGGWTRFMEPAVLVIFALSLMPRLGGWSRVAVPSLSTLCMVQAWFPLENVGRIGADSGHCTALLVPATTALAAHYSAVRGVDLNGYIPSFSPVTSIELWGLFSIASVLCGPLALLHVHAWRRGFERTGSVATVVGSALSFIALYLTTVHANVGGDIGLFLTPFSRLATVRPASDPVVEDTRLGVFFVEMWAAVTVFLACFSWSFNALAGPGSDMRRSLTLGESVLVAWMGSTVSLGVLWRVCATLVLDVSDRGDTPDAYVAVLLASCIAAVLGWRWMWSDRRLARGRSSTEYPPTLASFALRVATPVVGTAAAMCHVLTPGSVLGALLYCFADLGHAALIAAWAAMIGLTIALAVPAGVPRLPTTAARKIYHALAVAILGTGFAADPGFLCVGLAGALVALVALECLRSTGVPHPGHRALSSFMGLLADGRDTAGGVMTTHLSLLVGLAGPAWIHMYTRAEGAFHLDRDAELQRQLLRGSPHFFFDPAPLAGLIATGIGDACASVVGKAVGRWRWPGCSGKTVEGSAAGALAMGATVLAVGGSPRAWGCVVAVAALEAVTTQIDNLVLPFVMYAGLVFAPGA